MKKRMCLFCGKSHLKSPPKKCQLKSALSSALFQSGLPPHVAMQIIDRTPFLELAVARLSKIK